MKQRIFQVAILYHPTEKQMESGEKTSLVIGPEPLLASDQNVAFISACNLIPEKLRDKVDQLEIAVRPFSWCCGRKLYRYCNNNSG